jgi:DNA mismatch repair protein MutL
VKPIGAPVGTAVEIRDLFFNVAPRRKFLRSASTEAGHVADVLEAAALARPDVTFTLGRDGRRVREWLRVDSRADRVRSIVGEGLAACVGQRGPLAVEAHLSRPEHARAGAGGLRLLVNGRPVRDRSLLHTISQAYGSVLERGRYPRGVVYVDLPPALVDVNVHPQKGEVRFADHRAVTDAVYHLLSTELSRAFSLPTPSRSPWARHGGPAAASLDADGRIVGSAPNAERLDDGSRTPEDAVLGADVGPSELPAAPGESLGTMVVRDSATPSLMGPGVRWATLRFIAQVRQTYLVCEGQEGLFVIDQHAAAERVNFDRLRKQHRSRAVPSQALLFPLTFQVQPLECEIVEERSEELSALGMDIRVRGPETLSVHAVPKLLTRASPERLVRDLLAEVSRTGRRAFSDAVDLALATMACHGSIRAGDKLSESEASALLGALDFVDFAGHCPHGRPVVAVTSWSELERKVGRR